MKTSRLTLTCILLTLLAALPAMAGPRTFVSGLGNDANPGTRESAKRTFASALTVTDVGGEIVVLDSAGFASSTLTINKSVSIIAPPGLYAGVRVSSGDSIVVATTGTVVLRGLTINNGAGPSGPNGIHLTSGGVLHIENCVISGFGIGGNGAGVRVSIGATGARLFVKDTLVRENFNGIAIYAGTGSLDHVRLERNTGNGGLWVYGADPSASISNSVASGNLGGINSSDGATVTVSNCTVTNNRYGLVNTNGATMKSLGNNTVDGNWDGNIAGSITTIPSM